MLFSGGGSGALWIFSAALTASTIPAAAVVMGHLGSGRLGYSSWDVAIQRAAIGFVTTFTGAFIMASAMALLFFKISQNSRLKINLHKAPRLAMGLIWPSWFMGFFLLFPPLFNMGPETGEYLWMFLALLSVLRVTDVKSCNVIGVRRRWRRQFQIETAIFFLILFVSVSIIPSMLMRYFMGATGSVVFGEPPAMEWPHPPNPDW